MSISIAHNALVAHRLPGDPASDVPDADRLRGRTHAELDDGLTWLAWYAPGTFRAVMDHLDETDQTDG